jgi:hypothetical protein
MADNDWVKWVSIVLVGLYYVLYPVLVLLKAIWYILVLLSTPFVYVGRGIIKALLVPWRIFAKFEVRNSCSVRESRR